MATWTKDGEAEIEKIASDTGFSREAAEEMASAVASGNGTMAQFRHPELGGSGQWSSGGMVMIGVMSDDGLKARVRKLADAMGEAVQAGRIKKEDGKSSSRTSGGGGSGGNGGGNRWPQELGSPSSSGSQNGRHYAVFPDKQRVAVELDGKVTVYDSGDHRISGVSQQQGSSSSLRFSSQNGDVSVDELKAV